MTTRTMLKHFKWAFEQADEMLGAHIDGPNEQWFRAQLKRTDKALTEFKKHYVNKEKQ